MGEGDGKKIMREIVAMLIISGVMCEYFPMKKCVVWVLV